MKSESHYPNIHRRTGAQSNVRYGAVRRLTVFFAHPYLRLQENAVLHGQQVVRAIQGLLRGGFKPDLIIGHPGWGELLFVKDLLPDVPLISYCEFFYRGEGLDVGFDREDPVTLDTMCRARARSSHLLLSLESCDIGISPTGWQKSAHPQAFHDKIEVIFDGIDTPIVKPDGDARLVLSDGTVIERGDEILTYVARSLAALPEVGEAMAGRPTTVLRQNGAYRQVYPFEWVSRASNLRLHHARPIWIDGKVAGVVLVSRSPRPLFRGMYVPAPFRRCCSSRSSGRGRPA